MANLRELEERILASGKVEGHELEALRQVVYAGGRVDRRAADFLVVLHKRVQQRTPGFDRFYYQAIKAHILENGKISAAEAAWLRQLLFADGKIDDAERKFLHELRGEAQERSPEFEGLYEECMKQPMAQHTSG
jgi:uncharacterized tellurite resistance protein B-like protein